MRLFLASLLLSLLVACGGGGTTPSIPIPEAQASAPTDGCPSGDATAQLQAMVDTARGKLELPACVFNTSAPITIRKPLRVVCASATVDGTIIRSSADEGVVADPSVVVNIPTGGWNQRGYWFSIEDCRIEPAVKGGGKHALVVRARPGFFVSSSRIVGNHLGGFGEQGLLLENQGNTNGIFSTRVVGNFIENGVKGVLIGDSVQFIDNVVPSGAAAAGLPGFDLSFVLSAAESNLIRNNITTTGGCILIRNGQGIGIEKNWCETASKPAGDALALIQLNDCDSCTVRENRVQTLSGEAPYALAIFGGRGNEVASNKLNPGKAGHIVFTSSSVQNKLTGLNRFYGGADITAGRIDGASSLLTTP